jgi:hypothetical protein
MKQILFFSLIVLAVPGPGFAQEPAVVPRPPVSSTGKVLVLENERTLEGDIERIGDQYRIRRAIGETWVPSNSTLRLCNTTEEAYLFLRGRSNLNDADERLKLAQWCHDHGLRPQALTEVQAAVNHRPKHAASNRLLAYLQQQATQPQPLTPAAPASSEIDYRLALNLELTGDALGQFTARVQPILMNSCATCHATGRGGPFKLNRTHEQGNLRITQQNLASVLAMLNPQQPEASPFLTKALSLHGEMTQAPFRNRQAPAYRALEEWVRLTVANNPHSLETARDALPRSPTSIAAAPTPVASPEHPLMNQAAQPVPVSVSHPPVPVAPGSTTQTPPMPSPDDPNDPEIFNQGSTPPQAPPMPQPPQGRPGS